MYNDSNDSKASTFTSRFPKVSRTTPICPIPSSTTFKSADCKSLIVWPTTVNPAKALVSPSTSVPRAEIRFPKEV